MTMIRNTTNADLAAITAVCATRVYLEVGYCPGFQARVGIEVLRILARSNPMWWEDIPYLVPANQANVVALPRFTKDGETACKAWVMSFPRSVKRKLCALWGYRGRGLGPAGDRGDFRAIARSWSLKRLPLDRIMYNAIVQYQGWCPMPFFKEDEEEASHQSLVMVALMVALAKAGAPSAFVLAKVRKDLDGNWKQWVEDEGVVFTACDRGVTLNHPSGGEFTLCEHVDNIFGQQEDVRVLRRYLETHGLLQPVSA